MECLLIVVMVVVAHPKMTSGQIEQKTCVLIAKLMRNEMWKYIKNVLDGEFSPWPRWLWITNIVWIALIITLIIFLNV